MALYSSFYPYTLMLLKKSAEEHVCIHHVISPRLRMLLWCEINVNTAHCEHPCNSLQPFQILWMIILGSSVCKDLETSRVRLFLKHAAPSAVQNYAQNPLERIAMLSHFSIRNASIYFPSPSDECVQWGKLTGLSWVSEFGELSGWVHWVEIIA